MFEVGGTKRKIYKVRYGLYVSIVTKVRFRVPLGVLLLCVPLRMCLCVSPSQLWGSSELGLTVISSVFLSRFL